MVRILLSLLVIIFINPTNAAIITVDRNDDLMLGNDGGCDLRDAVNAANFNISFEGCIAGNSSGTDFILLDVDSEIQLQNEIDVLTSVSISPPFGSPNIVTIMAAPNNRIFEVHPTSSSNSDFELKNIRLIGANELLSNGGAILFYRFQNNDLGTIYIADCVFEDNSAKGLGGAISFENTNASSVSILRNTFSNNQANSAGAISGNNAATGSFVMTLNRFINNQAIIDSGVTTAGAVFLSDNASGDYTLEQNQFIANYSFGDAGALDLRGSINEQRYVLNKNVFFHNQAADKGGAISVGGLGFAEIYNSTLAFNAATRGGGLVNFGGKINLRSSTVIHNQASSDGQNIYVFSGNGSFNRNIIAYAGNGTNCAGNFSNISSGGSSVMDDQSCGFNSSADFEADPELTGLIYHSSGLSAFELSSNSAAIDIINPAVCLNADGSTMSDDQQGNPRPVDGNGDTSAFCDAGAIEGKVGNDIIWKDSLGG